MGLEGADEVDEPARLEFDVVVQQRDEFTVARLDRAVERSRDADVVGDLDDLNGRPVCAYVVDRAVARAIVYHDDPDVSEALSEHRGDDDVEKFAAVVVQDRDGHARALSRDVGRRLFEISRACHESRAAASARSTAGSACGPQA